MTPGARAAAAIEVLDAVLAGAATEAALLKWARGSRYAGSKDRAAVRDLVFDVIRRKRSAAVSGGANTGRGLVLGVLRQDGVDPQTLFTGVGYAPLPLGPGEAAGDLATQPDPIRFDYPDWLEEDLATSLTDAKQSVMETLRHRAPVFLRVNTRRGSVEGAQAALAGEGIETHPHPEVETALTVTTNPRRIAGSQAYTDGLIELQDAHSQATLTFAQPQKGQRVLDLCAGGGGKALALAATHAQVDAFDSDLARMKDLPTRADRSGAHISILQDRQHIPRHAYDLVFVDAPCSGSGAWRRSPEGKWALTPEKLDALVAIQAQLMEQATDYCAPGGTVVFVTCSVLQRETRCDLNATPDDCSQRIWRPSDLGDGFSAKRLRG
ncbi:MAG: RsmB/NOP family class I SAM-dependent RNA methyltransferase [Pseudomonadota bacterium]